jgi:hypothetical protein
MSLTYEHEMIFLCLGMKIFILLRCDLHLLKVLNTKWCSPHYVCIMWKELLKELMNQKRKDVLFSSMLFLCFKNFGYKIIMTCYDNWIKCIISLLYNACSMISTHLYLYKKTPKHLKPTYLWNYLTKMKPKIKSFENIIIQKKMIK